MFGPRMRPGEKKGALWECIAPMYSRAGKISENDLFGLEVLMALL